VLILEGFDELAQATSVTPIGYLEEVGLPDLEADQQGPIVGVDAGGGQFLLALATGRR
jgi:hypothetical protein